MAKSNAQRQAEYRARHLHDLGATGERLNVVIDFHAKLALERLAAYYGVTQRGMLEPLFRMLSVTRLLTHHVSRLGKTTFTTKIDAQIVTA